MKKYQISAAPHLRSQDSVFKRTVIPTILLIPVFLLLLVRQPLETLQIFGLVFIGVFSIEILGAGLLKKKIRWQDVSPISLVLLLTLLISPGFPVWAVLCAAAAGNFFGKIFFGGTGSSWLHPALLGYAVLALSFSGTVKSSEFWFFSFWNPYSDTWSFLTVLMLCGAGILMIFQKIIFWEGPLLYLAVILIPCQLMGIQTTLSLSLVLLTAFWMITDPSTTPATRRGVLYFSIVAALLTLIFDLLSVRGAPVFAVLTLNLLTPWIDEWILPRGLSFEPKAQGVRS